MKEIFQISKNLVYKNLVELKQLVFEVTDKCNLKCKYCAFADLYDGYDQRENKNLSFAKTMTILDYLQMIWRENITVDMVRKVQISFYGGEPLLNMSLITQIISYIETLPYTGRIFQYGMTTNAVLLDKHMDYLVEKNFSILISLDGDEQGQSYRVDHGGKNSFHRVINNVILLKEKYPDFWSTNVNFNSVLHDRNGIENTYQFFKDVIGKNPIISPINPIGVRGDKHQEFKKIYYDIPKEIRQSSLCEVIENDLFIKAPRISSVVNYLHRYSGNFYRNYLQLAINRDKLFSYSTGTCTPFSKKMFITVNGKILPCERISHDYAMGYVTDTDVVLNYEEIANKHNKNISKYLKQCKTCAVSKHCKQCVYQMDEMNRRNGICSAYMTEEQLELSHNEMFAYLGEHPELYKRILKEVSIGE